MTALAKADRARLAKLLGLLGSDHAGERDAAALAAHRLLQQRGVTWSEVLCGHVPMQVPEEFRRRAPLDIQVDLLVCIRNLASIKVWEQQFISTATTRSRISPKMSAVIREIADGLRKRGLA